MHWNQARMPTRSVASPSTFPARSFSVNGERRSFSLLRPTTDSTGQNRLRDLILEAYDEQAAALAETA